MSNTSRDWYNKLIKPSWAPPSWLFAPVWTVLYVVIFVSYGYVAYLYATDVISFSVLLPFILNIVFNLSFTPIQFGLRNNMLATIDIALVLATLLYALWVIFPHAFWIVYVNIPYVLWVSFATVLQFAITSLNTGNNHS